MGSELLHFKMRGDSGLSSAKMLLLLANLCQLL